MTLQFPSDPINGAVSGDYTYDAVKGAWRKNAALPVSVTHSDVAPSNPREGDQWWKSDEGTLFTYYNDGNSSQWVESTNVIANVEPNPIPAGSIMAWASDVVPSNWLLCDGSAVSRSTYASLFAAVGTQYGSGDGTTTFNLPNLKGRTIVGKDGAQSEFDTLGETGGAKTHTLTIGEIPSHTHIQDSHNHTQNSHNHTQNAHGHSINDPGHNHYMDQGPYTGGGNYTPPGVDNRYLGNAGTRTSTTGISINATTATNQATTATNIATTATNQNTGGGEAHNNLQPYIVLNYIIKFSAGETPGDSQLAVRVGALETQNNATPISQNYIINGAMEISQRGIGTTPIRRTATEYGLDRWLPWQYQVGRISQQVVTGTGPTSRLCMRVGSSTTALDAGTRMRVGQKIESINTYPLRGKQVTLSFYIRFSNATFTSSTATPYGNFAAEIGYYTSSTDSNFGTSTSDSSSLLTLDDGSLPTTWTKYTVTGIAPATANNIHVGFTFIGLGSTAANDSLWYEVTDVQLEEGPYATPFRRNAPSIQAELTACQRYYYQSAHAYGFYNIFNSGNMQSTKFSFPVTMRTSTPTVTVYDNAGTVNKITIANAGGTSQNGITPPATIQYTADGFMWVAGGMGGTVGNNGMVYMSRFDASAEL